MLRAPLFRWSWIAVLSGSAVAQDCTMERASLDQLGRPLTGHPNEGTLSDSGDVVAFLTQADAVPGGYGQTHVYVRELVAGTTVRTSGGTPSPVNDGTGAWSLDMDAFAAGLADGSTDPGLLVPSARVHTQWWGRDQGFEAPCNTSLSNGLQYDVGP